MDLSEYENAAKEDREHEDDHDVGHHHQELHEEHEEGEPWLVSYADMMTLLFGFFVLLYSFAKAEIKDDMVNVREEVAKYFGGSVAKPFADVKEELEKELEKIGMSDQVETKISPEGLEITFTSTVLYRLGSADILPHARKAFLVMIEHLKEKKEFSYGVRVEGHTDDNPIRSSPKFDTNWELSGARAASVVRIFEAEGFPARDMMAVGYGESRPKVPNRDSDGLTIAKNQAENRRVVVKVYITKVHKLDETKAKPPPTSHPQTVTDGSQNASSLD